MRKLRQFEGIALLLLAATLSTPARASETTPEQAVPGTLNYVEGNVSIGTQHLTAKSIGTAQLQAGQSLTTEAGKAEILLTPGVFLRVGNNSSVTMMSASLTNTELGLDRGQAMLEIAEIHLENNLRIAAGGETAQLLKTGLYDFDLTQHQLRVFEGKAYVREGDRHVEVKGGHTVALGNDGQLKSNSFDKKAYEDADLYRWSSLRSSYVAESNVDAATYYADYGWGPWGPGWAWGAGWYWDPWWGDYTFLPWGGMFFSPFGWGFYSPWFVYGAPFHPIGPRVYHQFSADYHTWGPGTHYVASRSYSHGIYAGAGSSRGGGFHSGRATVSGGRSGGGFAGRGGFGGGGFHGGGGGGRH
jgi:hypothetical protein